MSEACQKNETPDVFNKENLDLYLKELGKQFRKLNGKHMPAEIILIGGAAILARYGFRQMTNDMDAIIRAASSMKDAINYVGNKFDLPYGWMNDDFVRTNSYSPKLVQFSHRYKTFANLLEVRTVSAEYLVAMKLCSGREYKHDLSDIVGIMSEHKRAGAPITWDMIDAAVNNLYGGWEIIPDNAKEFIGDLFQTKDIDELYDEVYAKECTARGLLTQFEKTYPNALNQENLSEVLAALLAREEESALASVLENATDRSTKSDKDPKNASKQSDYTLV